MSTMAGTTHEHGKHLVLGRIDFRVHRWPHHLKQAGEIVVRDPEPAVIRLSVTSTRARNTRSTHSTPLLRPSVPELKHNTAVSSCSPSSSSGCSLSVLDRPSSRTVSALNAPEGVGLCSVKRTACRARTSTSAMGGESEAYAATSVGRSEGETKVTLGEERRSWCASSETDLCAGARSERPRHDHRVGSSSPAPGRAKRVRGDAMGLQRRSKEGRRRSKPLASHKRFDPAE